MRARGRWAFVAASLVALALIGSALAATAGHRTAQAKKPIIIGWAFDGKGAMAPFDTPALAAAQLRVAPGQREGRRQRTQASDPHLRYAGERPRDGEGLCACACSARRPTCSSRPATSTSPHRSSGGDRPRRPRDRPVHRHRPDGAEAVRLERAPGVQLRQRRAGRGLGDGAVRAGAEAGRRRRSRPTR